jgi:hypothetical protein
VRRELRRRAAADLPADVVGHHLERPGLHAVQREGGSTDSTLSTAPPRMHDIEPVGDIGNKLTR